MSTSRSPKQPNTPKPPGSGSGKKQRNSKAIIKIAVQSKVEELIRTSELDMMLQRRNLGLEPRGDMKDFIQDLIKKLKRNKRK